MVTSKGYAMAEYQLYCFAQSGNAYRAALMLNLITGLTTLTFLRPSSPQNPASLLGLLRFVRECYKHGVTRQHRPVFAGLSTLLPREMRSHDNGSAHHPLRRGGQAKAQ